MRKIGKKSNHLYLFLYRFLILIFLVLLQIPIGAQSGDDLEVTTSIDAEKVGLDDVLTYTITFKGFPGAERPQLDFEDFEINGSQSSRRTNIINGVATYYISYHFYLSPTRTGKLTIPAFKYEYQGKEYKARSFTIEAVKGSVTPHRPQSQMRRFPSIFDDDDFFSDPFSQRTRQQPVDIILVPQITKKKVVKGEEIIYKVLLYSRNNITSVNMDPNQKITGFWQEWFPVPRSIPGENKTYNGKQYRVFEVRKVALFPTKTGTLTIEPLKFELGLESGSFFSSARQIKRATPAIKIEVTDLPPAASNLPVGKFRLNVSALKSEIDINDILTLKVKISGNGNIKTLMTPELPVSDYYKAYPSKVSRDVSFSDTGVTGYVEAEIPVAVKKTGLLSFPPLEFKYYDPNSEEVVLLKSKPLMIKVSGVKEKTETVSTIGSTEIIKQGEDIDFITKGNIYDQEANYYRSRIFLYLLLLPFLINLLVILKLFVVDPYIINHPLLTGRKRLNHALSALKNVKNPAEISPVLENYLKEKAGLGLSSMTNHGIDALLSKYSVGDTDAKTFIRLKNKSDSSRFSPDKQSDSATKELKHDIKVLTEILKRIDSKIK